MRKKVLIIGSDSFIARTFIADWSGKLDISGISRIKTGNPVSEVVMQDLFTIEDTYFEKLDTVINFAAIVHRSNVKDRNLYKMVNTDLPIFLAGMAARNGVGQFIQMSSISVYGNKAQINPGTSPDPVNLYGRSKLEADLKLHSMDVMGMKVLSIRPPVVYGAPGAPGNMTKLIKLAGLMRYQLPLPLKNQALRSFIHIKNLTDFIGYAIGNSLQGIHLVTDREMVTIEQLIKIISNGLNIKSHMFRPGRPLKLLIRLLSGSTYRSLFTDLEIRADMEKTGFIPEAGIEQGIKDMIKKVLPDKQP